VIAMLRIARDTNVVVLTGAGISVSSGLRPFRGPGGMWNDIDVEAVLSAAAWAQHPDKVEGFLQEMREVAKRCDPTRAHLALAKAEQSRESGAQFDIVTQNIDGLHERAGSRRVHPIHGSLFFDRCEHCNKRVPIDSQKTCCDQRMHPDVVLFGEMLPVEVLSATQTALAACECFVAIGTSGVVWPAAGLVQQARRFGAHCINVNLEKSNNPAFHEELVGPCDDIVGDLFDL